MPQRSQLAMGFRALAHRNFQLFMSGQLYCLVRTPPSQVAQTGAGATGHRTHRWGSTVKGLKFQRSESAIPGLSLFPLEKLVEFVCDLI